MGRRVGLVGLGALLLITGACGGDESGGGSRQAATAAQVDRFCEEQCLRRSRCVEEDTGAPPEEDVPACAADCVADLGAIREHIRGDVTAAMTRCYENLECGTNDDVCTEDGAKAIGYESVDEILALEPVQRCLEKSDECDGTDGDFSDDICGTAVLLIDSAQDAVDRCFDEPCDAIGACLRPFFGD